MGICWGVPQVQTHDPIQVARAPTFLFFKSHHLFSSPFFITFFHHLFSSPFFITFFHHLFSSPFFITFFHHLFFRKTN